MNTGNINNTSFKGLWGFKTYNKQPVRESFSSNGYKNYLPRTLEKTLPFTRSEYLRYKSKNMQSKIFELSTTDKKIEFFLEPLMKGLSSYKNQYKEATSAEKLKLVLRRCVK
ncbi:hypothetical protein IJZ97_00400 [bacterium]|nr:hypothetical protein [bacterium]